MSGFLTDQMARLVSIPVIVFVIVFFVLYFTAQLPVKGTAEWVGFEREKGRARDFMRHPLAGRDWIAMAVVSVVYAAVTFFYLGDTDTPTSFYRFETVETPITIELDEPTELSRLQYYTGLNMRNHYGKTMRLEISADGETWDSPQSLNRDYAETFRWHEASLESYGKPIKALRLFVEHSGLDLGELALRSKGGRLIDLSHITVTHEGAVPVADDSKTWPAALLDEQSSVPERRTIMNGTHFDEIYHAYTAYEYIEGLYPYENTHPPLGKLTTMLGIKLFGMTPFGWRFMPALFGVLMLPFLYALIHFMFGKTFISVCGTVIFAFDFMHYVQTRISTIDVYAVFYVILMYLFMYRWMTMEEEPRFSRTLPSLALCGLSFGLGAASKWTCIYAALGLIVMYMWALIRRYRVCLREERKFGPFFWKTIAASLVFFAIIPAGIYVSSYIPYNTGRDLTVKNVWEACWSNQKTMLSYHSNLSKIEVKAPEDGKMVEIQLKKGVAFNKGASLAVMENAAGEQVTISAEQNARILKVVRKAGKTVKQGETVLVLTTSGHSFASRWYQWLFDIRPVYYYAGDYYDEANPVLISAPAEGVITEVLVAPGSYYPSSQTEKDKTMVRIRTSDGKTVNVPYTSSSKVTQVAAEAGREVRKGDTLLTLVPLLRVSASTFNNPIVSWGGLLAIIAVLLMLVTRRRMIGAFILVGYASQLVPWFAIGRTTYAYHYFPSIVFCVLALCFVFDTYLERAPALAAAATGKRALEGEPLYKPSAQPRNMIIAFTVVTVLLFVMFYPVLAAYPVPYDYVRFFLRWLPSWPV